MNLFGCKFCRKSSDDTTSCDRKNFDSLLWAIVTVFQVIRRAAQQQTCAAAQYLQIDRMRDARERERERVRAPSIQPTNHTHTQSALLVLKLAQLFTPLDKSDPETLALIDNTCYSFLSPFSKHANHLNSA